MRNINVELAHCTIDHTINSSPIWNESDGFKLVHEILKCSIDDVIQSRLNQPFNNPETVPIVLLSETPALMGLIRNDEPTRRLGDAYQVLQKYGLAGSKNSRTGPVLLRGKQPTGWSLELNESRMY